MPKRRLHLSPPAVEKDLGSYLITSVSWARDLLFPTTVIQQLKAYRLLERRDRFVLGFGRKEVVNRRVDKWWSIR